MKGCIEHTQASIIINFRGHFFVLMARHGQSIMLLSMHEKDNEKRYWVKLLSRKSGIYSITQLHFQSLFYKKSH